MSIPYPLSVRPNSRSGCGTMAAAVITQPGCVEFCTLRIPDPGPHEVTVRLEGCGVCETCAAAWQGGDGWKYPLAPGAPGCEAWGRVEAVGEAVEGVAPGDRVGVLTEAGFAEYALVDAGCVVALPEGLETMPFPAGALGRVVNVFRRSFIDKGDTVAVVGVGFLGAMLIQLAVLAEARVIAIGRRVSALRIAKQLGAMAAIGHKGEADYENILCAVRELNNGKRCDVVVEATGNQSALDLAAELTRERGRLVVAGTHKDGPRLVDMALWNERGFDVVNAHENSLAILREGIREAAAAVDCGLIKPGPLYSHHFSLGRLDDALRLVSERPNGFTKALVYL